MKRRTGNHPKPSFRFEHVPYSEIKGSICETWQGVLVSGFNLEPIDIECANEDTLNDIGIMLSRVLNSLSPEFCYSFSVSQSEDPKSRREFTLWIQSFASIGSNVPSLKTLKLISSLEISEEDRVRQFKDGVDRLNTSLQSSEINFSAVSGGRLVERLSSFFKCDSTRSLENFKKSDLIIQDDYFHYDHFKWGTLSVAEFPDQIATGQMAEILKLQTAGVVVFKFIPQASEKIIEQLKRKRKVTASLAVTNSRLKDMESEAKLQSEEDLLDGLVVGQEKVFECQVSVVTRASSPEELSRKLEHSADQLKSAGYQIYREAVSLYPVFQSCLPGCQIEKNRPFLLPTSCAQALIPIYDIDSGHPQPVIAFHNCQGGEVNIDPWDSSLASYNAVISGTSGSGKSFLTNVLLKRLVEKEQPSVFIIDIGGSYRRQSLLQGGQYITFDVQGANGFNPLGNLSINDPASLEAAVDILCAMVGDARFGVGKYERNIILQQLCEILSRDKQEITLSVLRERWATSELPFLKNASTILYGWTGDRAYGRLLDNTKKLEANSKWMCFDLRGLNDHVELQRVVMLSVVKRLWDIVRYSNDKKILVLDEVWALIQNNSGFIGEAFRTFRKHNASAIAVTQSLEDIATESLTAAVLNNTPTKIILKQSLKPERLQALLNLNSRELEIVRSLQSLKGRYSDFFMINGDKRRFLRLEPTPEDYWIATTNPTDLEFIKIFLTSHPELTELQACIQIAKLYGRKRP